MGSVFKNRRANYSSLIYGLVSLIATVSAYVIFTPLMDEFISIGHELLDGNEVALGLLTMFETLWHKATIPLIVVSIVVYMLVSAYQKEPNQY